MSKRNISRRLALSIAVLIVLCACLCTTTFALAYSTMLLSETNVFGSGYVSINLNDGRPVIEENEFVFEPGMTVRKSFFIENTAYSTDSVYYKIYFDNVEGELAEYLEIEIAKQDKVLYRGRADTLGEDVAAADDELAIGERRELTVTFYFPTDIGIKAGGKDLSFDLCADAVQTKNNPNRLFD